MEYRAPGKIGWRFLPKDWRGHFASVDTGYRGLAAQKLNLELPVLYCAANFPTPSAGAVVGYGGWRLAGSTARRGPVPTEVWSRNRLV